MTSGGGGGETVNGETKRHKRFTRTRYSTRTYYNAPNGGGGHIIMAEQTPLGVYIIISNVEEFGERILLVYK